MDKYFVTIFGIGFSKFAPGTLGSIFGVLFFYFCYNFFSKNYMLFFLFIFLIFIFSWYYTYVYVLKNKIHDPSEIIIDEFLGQSIPILFFYMIFYEGSVSNYFFSIIVFLSFVGFRFFDILKPYPINYVDKNMKNGFGVILDDLIAGFFTLIVLYICIIFYGQI